MTTTAEVDEVTGRLAEFVQRVQAGNEVLLTQGHKPDARIVAITNKELADAPPLQVRSLEGHRVLTPIIAQAELAEEMFGG